jgi:hypothetical protein
VVDGGFIDVVFGAIGQISSGVQCYSIWFTSDRTKGARHHPREQTCTLMLEGYVQRNSSKVCIYALCCVASMGFYGVFALR